MVLRFPVSGYPLQLHLGLKCNCKDTKKMAVLQDFSPKSYDFLLHLTLCFVV